MQVCFKIRRISKLLGSPKFFWLRLRFLRYSLWNKDLLHRYLDLLDTDITSKNFVCLGDVFRTSSRYVFKTSSRRLQDVFKTCWKHLEKRNIVTLKTCPKMIVAVLYFTRAETFISWCQFYNFKIENSFWRHLELICFLTYFFKENIRLI